MKTKFLLLVTLGLSISMFGATKTWVGGASGSWNDGANWSPAGVPGNGDDVVFDNQTLSITFSANDACLSLTLQNNADITFAPADATANRKLTIRNGSLTVNNGCTIRLDGFADATNPRSFTLGFAGTAAVETASISGTIEQLGTGNGGAFNTNNGTATFEATGVLVHNRNAGSIPVATWDPASTVNVIGITDNNPGNTDQSFGNFIWNCAGQIQNETVADGMTVAGKFTIESTGAGTNNLRSVNGGTITVNEFEMNGGRFQLRGSAPDVTPVFDVNGNAVFNGGIFTISSQTGVTGTLQCAGDLTIAGATVRKGANGVANVVFDGSSEQTVDRTSGAVNGEINLEVASGAEVNFKVLELNGAATFTNDGTAIFEDNLAVPSTLSIAGTGDIKLRRNLSTTKIWYEMGFAVTSGTVGDLVANWPIRTTTTNPGQSNFWNVYRWDAATADWVAASNTTPLTETALKIYAFGTNLNISVTVPNADFNNSTFAEDIDYDDGQSSSYLSGAQAATEGWNILYNPFQDNIDAGDLSTALGTDLNFTNTAIYIKDNTGTYLTSNGGVGDFETILPFQGMWLQANANADGGETFSFDNSIRTSTVGTTANSFKTSNAPVQLTLSVDGPDGTVTTHLVNNSGATTGYEGDYDARYLEGEHTQFYTQDANGVHYAINQTNTMGTTSIPLSFEHASSTASFTISADISDWDKNIKVFVKDKYLNKTKRLNKKRSYTFSNDANAPIDRFEIRFVPKNPNKTEDDAAIEAGVEVSAWFVEDQLLVMSDEEMGLVDISIYTITGQQIYQENQTNVNDVYPTITQSGVYVVRITNQEGETYTTKVTKL